MKKHIFAAMTILMGAWVESGLWTSENELPQPSLKLAKTNEGSQAIIRDMSNDTESKIQILDEIFQSKNDNDPRLDKEFRHLSKETKLALEKKYYQFQAEALNEKGTIVFLLGRNLTTQEDFAFMKEVIAEPACLSLSDCSQSSHTPETQEHSLDLTLNYPKIVALKSIERHLNSPTAIQVLEEATHSHNRIVSQMAHQLLDKSNRFTQ
jgi:hypothetical protein